MEASTEWLERCNDYTEVREEHALKKNVCCIFVRNYKTSLLRMSENFWDALRILVCLVSETGSWVSAISETTEDIPFKCRKTEMVNDADEPNTDNRYRYNRRFYFFTMPINDRTQRGYHKVQRGQHLTLST